MINWDEKPEWADRVVVGPSTGREYWASNYKRKTTDGSSVYGDDYHIAGNWQTIWPPLMDKGNILFNVYGYEDLADILVSAYDQASGGKGKERHANGRPFDQQPILSIQNMVGRGFALGQAIKKIEESQRMEYTAARNELLGAIVFIAGAIVHLDRNAKDESE